VEENTRLSQQQGEAAAKIRELEEKVQKQQRTIQAQENEIRAKQGEAAANIRAKELDIQRKSEQIAELQQKVDAYDSEQIQLSLGNLQSWNVPRAQIRSILEHEIGRGAWGVVYSGTFHGERVAIKQAHKDLLAVTTIDALKREVMIMAHIQHPNLVRFIAAVFDDAVENGTDMPIIVSELMDTNLRAAYTKLNLSNSLVSIFCDVAYALHYLHQHRQPIIHRDLSAPNVLLKALQDGAYQAKVSDFGSANLAKQAQTTRMGAIIYSAPEMKVDNDDFAAPPQIQLQTTKVDVFSYGVLMLEVLAKEIPTIKKRHTMLQRVSRDWKELILHCTKRLPSDRPTMSDILTKLYKLPRPH
jgi:serine/threonine protein kinase